MHYPNQTGVATYREAFGKIDFVYVVEPYDGKIKSLFFLFSDGSCTMLSGQESDHLTILLISRWAIHNAPQPRVGSFDVEQIFYHCMYCT
jgi:hypothetical protein